MSPQQKNRLGRMLIMNGLVAVIAAAQPPRAKAVHEPAPPDTQESPVILPGTARLVSYSERDQIVVKTKVRFTTLIVLPKTEQILDFTCGDKEFWVVNGNQNFAYIKPAKPGAQTNLNLVAASGNIYSFVLSEISQTPKAEPDLKLFVELKDPGMVTASRSAPRFVSADEVAGYKQQVQAAQQEANQAKQAAQKTVERGVRQFVSNVRFSYRFEAGKKPFFVRSMYHDDRFTYIQARPEETPTLYEIKEGQPNLVNFEYRDGLYVVDKILDRGYLAVGKQKLGFTREE
jgi:type IV secretory pathway VirB9-like protein